MFGRGLGNSMSDRMSDESETPGERVRRLREAKGLTQQQLADKAGVVKNQVYKVESGRIANPQRNTLERYARALGTSVAYLRFGAAPDIPEELVSGVDESKWDEAITSWDRLEEILKDARVLTREQIEAVHRAYTRRNLQLRVAKAMWNIEGRLAAIQELWDEEPHMDPASTEYMEYVLKRLEEIAATPDPIDNLDPSQIAIGRGFELFRIVREPTDPKATETPPPDDPEEPDVSNLAAHPVDEETREERRFSEGWTDEEAP